MNEVIETCRRLYNNLLDDRSKNGTDLAQQKRELTKSRRENKHLKKVHSQVIQNVCWRLQRSFRAFSIGNSGRPKFKREGKYNSFTYPQVGGFAILNDRLRLSMIGRIRIKLHRDVIGQTKTCTIVRRLDQWYACLATVVGYEAHCRQEVQPVGVDLGISSAITLSDGTRVAGPKFLKMSEDEIVGLQKSLSRKIVGSRNRNKARLKLAKAWRRVANRRIDFAHKTSRHLADNYNPIIIERLAVKRMVKNHKLASAILDACWGRLRQLTAAKAERLNGRVILVEPRGTSQKCSECGKCQGMSLSMRVFSCKRCGLMLDRDVNAAKNVLAKGLERARVEAQPIPSIWAGKLSRGSKKPDVSRRGSSRQLSTITTTT